MKQYDDFDDDDLFGDDDALDNFAKAGGSKTHGSAEERLAAKYSDYLMWRDTGSSHDEALDLANMSEDEYDEAEAGNDPESGAKFTSLDELDDNDFSDDENDEYGSSGSSRNSGRNSDYDDY